MIDMNKIGNYIKEERKKAGLTQEEFAMRSGLGLRFVRAVLLYLAKDLAAWIIRCLSFLNSGSALFQQSNYRQQLGVAYIH